LCGTTKKNQRILNPACSWKVRKTVKKADLRKGGGGPQTGALVIVSRRGPPPVKGTTKTCPTKEKKKKKKQHSGSPRLFSTHQKNESVKKATGPPNVRDKTPEEGKR